jgi:adenosylcobinamide-GDP ribazoletransferase
MRDALGLLTTIGRRGGALSSGALRWFPVVGAGLGAVLGAWWWLAERWWPVAVAAGLVVAADLALTGLLHVDGLADTADGLLPHASPAQRLTIMRAPDVGAFGVAAVIVVLGLRTVSLAALVPSVALLTAIWCASRCTVASVPAMVPYARDAGIASPLLDGAPRWPVLASVPAGVVAAADVGIAGAAAVATTVLAAIGVVALGRTRLGGFTGDVLGAAIIVGETGGLLVGAARW